MLMRGKGEVIWLGVNPGELQLRSQVVWRRNKVVLSIWKQILRNTKNPYEGVDRRDCWHILFWRFEWTNGFCDLCILQRTEFLYRRVVVLKDLMKLKKQTNRVNKYGAFGLSRSIVEGGGPRGKVDIARQINWIHWPRIFYRRFFAFRLLDRRRRSRYERIPFRFRSRCSFWAEP